MRWGHVMKSNENENETLRYEDENETLRYEDEDEK